MAQEINKKKTEVPMTTFSVTLYPIRITLPEGMRYTGKIIDCSCYENKKNGEVTFDLSICPMLATDGGIISSEKEARESFATNGFDGGEETDQIEPFQLSSEPYNIWACGYYFSDNMFGQFDFTKRFYAVFIQKGNKISRLRFYCDPELFDENLPIFNQIVNSVEFIDDVR